MIFPTRTRQYLLLLWRKKKLILLNLHVLAAAHILGVIFSSSVSILYDTAKLIYGFDALLVLYPLIDIPHIYFQKIKSYLFCKIQFK